MEQDDQKRPLVECVKHGLSEYCMICRHLRDQSNLNYYAVTAEIYAPGQAWCEACDQVLEEERGWSDRADEFAGWNLLCSGCYAEMLARHELIAWSVGSDEEELLGQSIATTA